MTPSPAFAFAAVAALVPNLTPLDTLTSGFASIARLPRGVTVTEGSRGGQTDQAPPTLYDMEGCPFCRRVREVATELDMVVNLVPSARGSRSRDALAEYAAAAGSNVQVPFLLDGDTRLFESEEICRHLIAKYGATVDVPGVGTGFVASALRLGRGGLVDKSALPAPPDRPLVLYSYEGNQFCRLVREARAARCPTAALSPQLVASHSLLLQVLCELDLPYELRSAGKGSPRREELKILTGGSSQCPFLLDPNSGVQLAESADIVEYLRGRYSRGGASVGSS